MNVSVIRHVDTHRLLAAIVLSGLAISVLMMFRSQVSDDSLQLLSRGWLLAKHGILSPIGNAAAEDAGGYVPGSVSAIVTGLPLYFWMDHRAPVVLIVLFHVLAWFLLDRVVKAELGERARVIFAILFWLNPWRVYQSGWVDNSNFVFLAGAVHLWACYVQREAAKFAPSLLLVVAVGLTIQLHLSAFVLVIAALLLWWRGYWQPHWGGVAAGTIIVAVSLIPFMLEAIQHPEIIPGHGEELPGSNLVKVWPVLKGFAYWLRYPSLYTSEDMTVFDFSPFFGPDAGPVITPLFVAFTILAAAAGIVMTATANIWWLRAVKSPSRKSSLPSPASAWLSSYALWTLAACLLANALSPEVTMWWHNFIVLHAATIPILIWLVAVSNSRRSKLVPRGLTIYASAAIVMCLGMSLGSAHFRQGGDRPIVFPQPERHEMIEDLGLNRCCTSDPVRWKPKQLYFYEHYLADYALADSASSSSAAQSVE